MSQGMFARTSARVLTGILAILTSSFVLFVTDFSGVGIWWTKYANESSIMLGFLLCHCFCFDSAHEAGQVGRGSKHGRSKATSIQGGKEKRSLLSKWNEKSYHSLHTILHTSTEKRKKLNI